MTQPKINDQQILEIDATLITSGVLDVDRIPGLPATRIVAEVFDEERISRPSVVQYAGTDVLDLVQLTSSGGALNIISNSPFLTGSPLFGSPVIPALPAVDGSLLTGLSVAQLVDLDLPEVYTSSDFTVAPGTLRTATHGLTAIPDVIQLYAKCLTGEFGYSVGDVVLLNPTMSDFPDGSPDGSPAGILASNTISANTTDVKFAIGRNGLLIGRQDSPVGEMVVATSINWNVFIKAIKF